MACPVQDALQAVQQVVGHCKQHMLLCRSMYWRISADIPGQKTRSRARRRHEFMPRCPECTLTLMSLLRAGGMTTRTPRRTIPSWTVSSSLWSKYGRIAAGSSLLVFGQPRMIWAFSSPMSSSTRVAVFISSRRSFLIGVYPL